jgi:hypothetical protein
MGGTYCLIKVNFNKMRQLRFHPIYQGHRRRCYGKFSVKFNVRCSFNGGEYGDKTASSSNG